MTVLGVHPSLFISSNTSSAAFASPAFSHAEIRLEYVMTDLSMFARHMVWNTSSAFLSCPTLP